MKAISHGTGTRFREDNDVADPSSPFVKSDPKIFGGGLLVGLSGYAQTGKTTIADHLVEWHGFKKLSFAEALRTLALAADPIVGDGPDSSGGFTHLSELVDAVGWEQAKKNPEVRRFLQLLGTEGCRTVFGDDIWVRPIEHELLAAPSGQAIVIDDCRYLNEAKLIKRYGGEVCRVARPGYLAISGHVSERALDTWVFDDVFINNTTPEELGDFVEQALDLQ